MSFLNYSWLELCNLSQVSASYNRVIEKRIDQSEGAFTSIENLDEESLLSCLLYLATYSQIRLCHPYYRMIMQHKQNSALLALRFFRVLSTHIIPVERPCNVTARPFEPSKTPEAASYPRQRNKTNNSLFSCCRVIARYRANCVALFTARCPFPSCSHRTTLCCLLCIQINS